ncbi:Fe2+-enterobactin ABC transporter substrate-binding protein [Corynebacterium pseudodiphtheriticum]|uniref:Fe2+-enterobactin ABC transporter substrate-binding protein n=1 Tax=Corynebacterium pseudodiphtheriticum TaxID=37637 RepID=UPI0020C0FB19|nr:Fe2+-enterobactin ABC transporter substrate-binding protein [Corynebacterium pseudodiphtheriticum]UQV54404.1 Fe2+-enterobactin ABC transporter substrate-binding protein [Corynebacterium pseudodiphtheriticum]
MNYGLAYMDSGPDADTEGRKMKIRRRVQIIGAVLTASSLVLVSCSQADESANGSDAANTSAQATSSETAGETAGSEDDATSWPRTVDSLVVNNGEVTGDTEEVEITEQPKNIVSTSVTLTGSLLAMDAPIKATGGAAAGGLADEQGFFLQWADEAIEQGVESLYNLEVDVEAIAAQDPDMIVVSASGQDSAVAEYDKLSAIGVPVVVVDYSDQGWDEIMSLLAEATGHEKDAAEAMQKYEDRLEEVTKAIELPEQPTNFVMPLPGDRGLNFWSAESAQGQLLEDIGFEVAVPDDEIVDTAGPRGARKDVKTVVPENAPKAITGETVLTMSTTGGDPVESLKNNPLLANNPAIANDAIYLLSPELFRLDFYSAMMMLDELEKHFAK